jgi:hypothetical protein
VDLIELTRHVLARALEPFPVPVRTLDGLHLAAMTSVRATGEPVQLASYDARLTARHRRSASRSPPCDGGSR